MSVKTWLKLKKNKNHWKNFFIREKILKTIREFFYKQKFHELETPILVPWVIPESYLDVFDTYLKNRNGQKTKMFLTTSPEASIKKLLVAGIGNCFEITKSFRNGEIGSLSHNPEFTILEWYRVNATYKDVMKDTENLIVYICNTVKNNKNDLKINYQGQIIDLTPPWERISVAEAFLKYAKTPYETIDTFKKISKVAKELGYSINKNDTWETIFHQIFFNEVESKIKTSNKPVILYDYPKALAALSKIKKADPRFAERFEFYIGGLELGDCYTELTDFVEQEKRFAKQLTKTSVSPDKDFLEALKIGLPDCSGIAVGVDRLVMLFTDSKTIDETLLFPMNEMIKV